MDRRLRIRLDDAISPAGIARLPASRYETGAGLADPDAILVRSRVLSPDDIPPSVLAVARAGAGVNTLPVEALTARGVPVFNTPGANANAVKELVIAALLMGARRLGPARDFVRGLAAGDDYGRRVEEGKRAFAGEEIAGRTLGIVGLGAVGAKVAEAAMALGMRVAGFDPALREGARLPAGLERVASLDELLPRAQYLTLHVPLVPATRHLVDASRLAAMPAGAVLLNFAREAVVDEAAVVSALDAGRLAAYLCDFPSPRLAAHPRAVAFPHLGASTGEAEAACAGEAARLLRAYLEDGEIGSAVNFPPVAMARESAHRVALANANVPNMLGRISTTMARAGLNIHNMVNKSLGSMAYTLVDLDSAPGAEALAALSAIEGVLAVRFLPALPEAAP